MKPCSIWMEVLQILLQLGTEILCMHIHLRCGVPTFLAAYVLMNIFPSVVSSTTIHVL